MTPKAVVLPPRVLEFLDGSNLREKIGRAIELVGCESDGWPRVALLSVGEVLAVSTSEVRLALHADSRTTQAVTQSEKALLCVVLNGASYKIRTNVERVGSEDQKDPAAYFRGHVAAVDEDRVGYARIVSGITYTLLDEEAVLTRWQHQIDHLRSVE